MDNVPSQAWLCLRLTHLSLNSLGFKLKSDPPLAISYQQQIWQCNSSALQTGIKIGMSISHALMLNPYLQLQERDIQSERNKRQELSYWAYRFTSLVSLHSNDILLLEIGKSIKLFNGLNHIIHLINQDLDDFGIAANLGLAETPKAAIVLSRINHQKLDCSHTALTQVKLEYLELDNKTTQELLHCGFKTVSDINTIPLAELGSRFGRNFLTYLQQLWGKLADPQIAVTPPEAFHACADFAEPINNITWIQQQLDRLLENLEHFITSRQLICRSFTWRFYGENGRLIKTVCIGVSAQQNLGSIFRELTHLKLERIKLNWEFSSITLSSDHLLPIQLFNNDLFNPTPNREQFQQLLDKLINRLGHSSVFQITQSNEYLPELANRCSPANTQQFDKPPSIMGPVYEAQSKRALKDEPLWLLEKPECLIQNHRLPTLEGPLNIIHGPNRISSHWWARLQSRDYFIARQRNGRLLWIFFDRANKNWFLHGLYA